MSLYNSPRHNTYLKLLRQRPILLEVKLPLIADVTEFRVVGHPICEVVLGEYSKMGATSGSIGDKLGGASVIGGRLHGLESSEWREGWRGEGE